MTTSQELKWKTQDERELLPSEMYTNHIKNSLKLLRSKGFISPSLLNFYLTCSVPNGEQAQYAFENELSQILKCPVSPFIDLFENELKKRGESL